MGLILYFASLLLSLTATVGLSPLTTQAKLTLDPLFAAGTVCLIWESTDEGAVSGADCWTVEHSRQRTWVKGLKLWAGTYEVWVTTVGQDEKGNAMKMTSPVRRVEVY